MTAPHSPVEALASLLADRYRLERELGAGGMATVWLARDLKHGRPVALKILRPELAALLGAERFLAEIRTTARLQHPHILPLLDSGAGAGLLYYVMPYVTGESLRARLDRERQLSVEETVRLTRALAAALDYAHREGIVHRDLKPDNILLQEGEPVLADFGIALALSNVGGERLTATGLSLGTPIYMSPEQAGGDRGLDARSDVYSLACVVYECLAGEPPFGGASAAAIIAKVLSQAPTPLEVVRPGVPQHVAAAVMRALSKAPADRFPSAGAFGSALGGASRTRRPRPWAVPVGMLLLGAVAVALGVFQSRRRSDPAVARHLARGNELFAARTPVAAAAALAQYDSALAREPGHAGALARKAFTFTVLADWGWSYQGLAPAELRARAVEWSQRAITADSGSAEAWLARATVLLANDPYRLRGVEDAFRRALALDSTSAEAWYQYGQAAMFRGDDGNAAAAYRRSFALDPNRPIVLVSLAALAMQHDSLPEARRLLDSAIAVSRTGASPYLRVMRGRVELAGGHAGAARHEAELALAMDSTYPVPARALLVSALWAEGQPSQAEGELRRLLVDLGPADPSPVSALHGASALLSVGRRDEAIRLLERAQPRGAELWFYLRLPDFRPLRSDSRFRRVLDGADPREVAERR